VARARLVVIWLLASCLTLSGAERGLASPQNGRPANTEAVPVTFPLLPYVRDGDIWLVSLDGVARWRVTEGGRAWAPTLSPTGRRLAYWLMSDLGPTTTEHDAGLWVLDTGDARRHLLTRGPGPHGVPAWSPEGQRLAWISGNQLMVADLEGRARARIRLPLPLANRSRTVNNVSIGEAQHEAAHRPGCPAPSATSTTTLPSSGDRPMDLLSVVLTLRPSRQASLPPRLGRASRAILLERIAEADPELAEILHGGQGPKPYTCSNLMGPQEGGGFVLPGASYTLRYTALSAPVAAAPGERG